MPPPSAKLGTDPKKIKIAGARKGFVDLMRQFAVSGCSLSESTVLHAPPQKTKTEYKYKSSQRFRQQITTT